MVSFLILVPLCAAGSRFKKRMTGLERVSARNGARIKSVLGLRVLLFLARIGELDDHVLRAHFVKPKMLSRKLHGIIYVRMELFRLNRFETLRLQVVRAHLHRQVQRVHNLLNDVFGFLTKFADVINQALRKVLVLLKVLLACQRIAPVVLELQVPALLLLELQTLKGLGQAFLQFTQLHLVLTLLLDAEPLVGLAESVPSFCCALIVRSNRLAYRQVCREDLIDLLEGLLGRLQLRLFLGLAHSLLLFDFFLVSYRLVQIFVQAGAAHLLGYRGNRLPVGWSIFALLF